MGGWRCGAPAGGSGSSLGPSAARGAMEVCARCGGGCHGPRRGGRGGGTWQKKGFERGEVMSPCVWRSRALDSDRAADRVGCAVCVCVFVGRGRRVRVGFGVRVGRTVWRGTKKMSLFLVLYLKYLGKFAKRRNRRNYYYYYSSRTRLPCDGGHHSIQLARHRAARDAPPLPVPVAVHDNGENLCHEARDETIIWGLQMT